MLKAHRWTVTAVSLYFGSLPQYWISSTWSGEVLLCNTSFSGWIELNGPFCLIVLVPGSGEKLTKGEKMLGLGASIEFKTCQELLTPDWVHLCIIYLLAAGSWAQNIHPVLSGELLFINALKGCKSLWFSACVQNSFLSSYPCSCISYVPSFLFPGPDSYV